MNPVLCSQKRKDCNLDLLTDPQQCSNLFGIVLVLDLCLLLFPHRNKILGHVAHVHHASSVLEHLVDKNGQKQGGQVEQNFSRLCKG